MDSIHHHEMDRGSINAGHHEDIATGAEPHLRDQMFIRDGNAEILRLVTRGRIEEDEPRLNQPDTRPYTVVDGLDKTSKHEEEGKEIIMQRFIEDQKKSTEATEPPKKEKEELQIETTTDAKENKHEHRNDNFLQSLIDVPQRNLSTGDVNRLTTLQRDLLLTRFLVEEQRRTFAHNQAQEDTQSLPGVVPSMTTMATQTDVNRSTQTEVLYTMRPARRKAKSDLDDSGESDTENVPFNSEQIKKISKYKKKVDSDFEVFRSLSRCEIKTPILEESESALENTGEYNQPQLNKGITGQNGFAATKSSVLRFQSNRMRLEHVPQEQPTSSTKYYKSSESSSGTNFNFKKKSYSEQNIPLAMGKIKDLEMKSKSLQTTPVSERKKLPTTGLGQKQVKHDLNFDYDSDDELEDILYRSKSSLSTRNASTSPIQIYSKRRSSSSETPNSRHYNAKDITDYTMEKNPLIQSGGRKLSGQYRYMEWYKTKREERERKKAEEKEMARQKKMKPIKSSGNRRSRPAIQTAENNKNDEERSSKLQYLKTAHAQVVKNQNEVKQSESVNRSENKKLNLVKSHKTDATPEKRLNLNDLNEEQKGKGIDDDRDSGIAMHAPGSQRMKRKNQNLMDKKSVFTIAYDDMQTKQIRLDSASPP